MMAKPKLVPYLKVLLAVVFWGASFIATKIAVRDLSPITIVWLRFGIGVLILGIAVFSRKEFSWPAKNEWGYFALLGFLGIAFHAWLQSTGLITAQASTTAWIVATTPIFIALLGRLVLKENLDWRQGAGIILATFGVLLVVSNGGLSRIFSANFGTPGDLLIVISSINWAVFSVLSRRGLQAHPAARMMFFVMAFGWMFSSIAFFTQGGLGEIHQLTSAGWAGVAFLGIFCSGLAYIAWYDALQALPVSQVGAFLYLEPLVTVIIAGIILAEPVTWVTFVGGAGILTGVYLVNRKKG